MQRSKPSQRIASRRSALTRQHPHRLIDLLLGAFLLAGVAIGIGSLSPVLAIVLVILVVGAYLAGLLRQERQRRRRIRATAGQRAD